MTNDNIQHSYPDPLGIVLEADLPDVEAVVPGLAAAPHAVEGEASQVAADTQAEVVPCPLVNKSKCSSGRK